MEESKCTNSIYLMGEMLSPLKYSHTVYGEGFYNFEMGVSRLSGKMDVLPLTVSERILDFSPVYEGEVFSVTGQIRSYNKRNEDGSNRLLITVFIKEIIKEPETQQKNANEVTLEGYVCKPTTYRVTPLGREITDMLLAVNRAFNKSDYIPCIVWGRNAKFAKKFVPGNKLAVCGRLQSRDYEKALDSGDIIVRTAFEVSLNNIEQLK
jgi:primosomal replication protein N